MLIKKYMRLYRGQTFLRKGSSPVPPFQRLYFCFCRDSTKIALLLLATLYFLCLEPMYCHGKNQIKVFGREFEGDSPQCGEMSAGQRGRTRLGGHFLKRGSLNNPYVLLHWYLLIRSFIYNQLRAALRASMRSVFSHATPRSSLPICP